MSTQHTPGPWKIEKNDAYEEYWVQLEHYTVGPARIVFTKADAALIAAAPDLLDALQLCEGNISSLLASAHPKVFGEWLRVVSEAIAKATGEIK